MALSGDEIVLLGDIDDDWYGLWEVDWRFNKVHPEWPRATRTAFVSALVRRELIHVFFGPLLTERPPLPQDAALQALADPAAWAPPADAQTTGYYMTVSPAGIAALRTQAA